MTVLGFIPGGYFQPRSKGTSTGGTYTRGQAPTGFHRRLRPPSGPPPGSGGGSFPLPGLPPISPNPFNVTSLVLLALELLFPAEVADGTIEGNPVEGFGPQDWGAFNPVRESEDPGLVVPRGTYTYRGATSLEIYRYLEVFPGNACPGGSSTSGLVINDGTSRFTFNSGVVPSTIEVEANSPRLDYNCGGSSGNNDITEQYPLRVRQLDGDGNQVGDWQTYGEPQPGGTSYENTNDGGREWVAFVTEVNYASPSLYPPEAPPGPITPQPDPYPGPDLQPKKVAPFDLTSAPEPATQVITAPQPDIQIPPNPRPVVVPNPPDPEIPDIQALPEPELAAIPIPSPSIPLINGVPAPAPITPPAPTPPDVHFPIGPNTPIGPGGVPPSLPGIADEVGRIEQKTAKVLEGQNNFFEQLDNILDLVELLELIKDLFEKPLPAQTYSITGVCEEGDPQPSTNVELPKEKWADRLISLGDMMPTLLQAHLGYKTPICGQAPSNEKPQLDGTWISTRWVSDGDSPGGTERLRKLFRYRSKSTRDVDELRAYWAGFTWEAGPVIVWHRGAWWGEPKVWAASEAEGKRVLRFAAGEAGIDPDLDGEWRVGSSRNPRYGQTGTMRLETPRGTRWVTRRDGPSGLPE